MIRNENRAANGVAKVVLLVGGFLGGWIRSFLPGFRVEKVIPYQ
jgi:hypothetical protein